MCEKGVFLCSSSNHKKFSLESPDHSELISEVLLFSFLRVGLATQLRWILNLGLQVCTTIHAHQEPMSKWTRRRRLFLEGGVLLAMRHPSWPQWWLRDFWSPPRLNSHRDINTRSCSPEAYYSHRGQIRMFKSHEFYPLDKPWRLCLHLVGTDKQEERMYSNSVLTSIGWIKLQRANCLSDNGEERGQPRDRIRKMGAIVVMHGKFNFEETTSLNSNSKPFTLIASRTPVPFKARVLLCSPGYPPPSCVSQAHLEPVILLPSPLKY